MKNKSPNTALHQTKKNGWDKTIIIATIIASIAIPSVIAFYGNKINKTIHEDGMKAQYVGIAVQILNTDPTPETCELRYWAIDILRENSPISLSNEAIQTLKHNSLPSREFVEPGVLEPGIVENKC